MNHVTKPYYEATFPIKTQHVFTISNGLNKKILLITPGLPELVPDFVMERFSNWLNSYTKAFNKVYQRKGSLFIDYMRRVPVAEDKQFGATIFYIHKNPVHHGLVKHIEDWKWSSYKSFFSKEETSLQRGKVLGWFQGIEAFNSYHQQPIYLKDAVVPEE